MAGQDENKVNGDASVSGCDEDPTENDQNTDVNLCEEYDFLDTKLDELNSVLDLLEQKNDAIHERLKELLQSNIEIRNELRNENRDTEEINNA